MPWLPYLALSDLLWGYVKSAVCGCPRQVAKLDGFKEWVTIAFMEVLGWCLYQPDICHTIEAACVDVC